MDTKSSWHISKKANSKSQSTHERVSENQLLLKVDQVQLPGMSFLMMNRSHHQNVENDNTFTGEQRKLNTR